MGVSTDGILCFGIFFDEQHIFPWNKGDYHGDHEQWWRDNNDFNPSIKFDDCETDAQYDKFFDECRKWDKKHPCPFEPVNYCSNDCDMYILIVPESQIVASRGYPEKIKPEKLKVPEKKIKRLIDFCKKYKIRYTRKKTDPQWYLCSYWG